MGSSRTIDTEGVRTFMTIATPLWLVRAIVAVSDGDTLISMSWFSFAVCGALFAGGLVHRSQGIAYLAITLLVVGVAISVGVFIADI